MRPKQLAITKTPKRHGTYCIRVALVGGETLEYISSRAQTYEELIQALEQRLVDLRWLELMSPLTQGDPSPDSLEDLEAHPWKGSEQ